MTTATQNEEDLIIIWDETSSDTSIIDFDFSPVVENKVSQPEETDFILDFGNETKNEVSTDFFLDTPSVSEETSEVISFGDDFFGSQETPSTLVGEEKTASVEEIVDIQETPLSMTEENTSVMDMAWETLSEEINFPTESFPTTTTASIDSHHHFDRNAILDEAIAKMQSRKLSITTIKTQKETTMDDLNEQIKSLKSQLNDLEKEVKDLEKEDSALDLDISSIEKMKESVLDIASDRPRKHNLSTIKK